MRGRWISLKPGLWILKPAVIAFVGAFRGVVARLGRGAGRANRGRAAGVRRMHGAIGAIGAIPGSLEGLAAPVGDGHGASDEVRLFIGANLLLEAGVDGQP